MPTSEDLSNQEKQLCLEPEPDLSIYSTFEDSIWPVIETTTDATFIQMQPGLMARSRLIQVHQSKLLE